MFGFGQPGFVLPGLGRVTLEAQGYATAVQPGDVSLAVPPAGLSAGFSRYFNAAVSHPATAPAGYTSNLVPVMLRAERTGSRYGWRVFGESTGWQAASAAATLSAPQAAVNSGAAPPPFLSQKVLHVTSVSAGLRLVGTLVGEHLAMDPPRGGTVPDYFNGKSIGWAKR